MNLSVLESVARSATFKGESLKVSPLKVGQIPAFTRAIRPVFAAFAGLFSSIPLGGEAGGGGDPIKIDLNLEHLAELISEHGDALMQAVAIAIRKDVEDVRDLELDEFIALVRAILEVNADFFGRAMAKVAR